MTTPGAPVKILGRYALYEPIAAGGMATVHFGRLLGEAGFSRTVAIKRMHAQFANDPEFVAMFLDEARLAGRLRHPNVVPIVDVVAEAGELFLVMDYVPGETLSRVLRAVVRRGEQAPLPVVSAIICGLLEGLHAAHEARDEHGDELQIVHRDVSPQNVLVGTDGGARVLDFGIAKALNRLHSTEAGRLKGKYAYMSPEQVRGEVCRQTDVYAAAVCLWEALTATRLFDGEPMDILRQVNERTIAPPSTIRADIPKELDEVVMRGVARDLSIRYGSGREMARALQRVVPPAPPSDVGDWVAAVAGTEITKRAAHVARIESGSARVSDPTTIIAELRATEITTEDDGPRTDSAVSVSGAEPRTHRGRAAIFVAAILALGIGVGVLATRRDPAPPPVAAAPPPASTPEPIAVPPASTPAVVVASVSAAPVATIVSKPKAIAKPKPALDCNPPYVIDSKGKKRFKAECL